MTDKFKCVECGEDCEDEDGVCDNCYYEEKEEHEEDE